MSRFPAALLVGLLATQIFAAPVSADKAAKQKELDALWAELYKDEPAASTALLKLFKQPDHAVPFVKAKLQPLKLDQNRRNEQLKDLGSDDEKTWKAAWDELDYLDPRLAIGLHTLMNDITENPSRTRMVKLMSGYKPGDLNGKAVTLSPVGDGFNFRADGSWCAEHRIERIGGSFWNTEKSWTRAARGVAILEQLGTPEAVKVLEQIAEGHPEAFPTKGAKASLERIKKK